jgi:hypothetical protein
VGVPNADPVPQACKDYLGLLAKDTNFGTRQQRWHHTIRSIL